MQNGIVLSYDPDKGYGFVQVNEPTHEHFFFHKYDLLDVHIKAGAKCTFDVVKSKQKPGKLCAINVAKIL
jgi:cold shock CspA family protein